MKSIKIWLLTLLIGISSQSLAFYHIHPHPRPLLPKHCPTLLVYCRNFDRLLGYVQVPMLNVLYHQRYYCMPRGMHDWHYFIRYVAKNECDFRFGHLCHIHNKNGCLVAGYKLAPLTRA